MNLLSQDSCYAVFHDAIRKQKISFPLAHVRRFPALQSFQSERFSKKPKRPGKSGFLLVPAKNDTVLRPNFVSDLEGRNSYKNRRGNAIFMSRPKSRAENPAFPAAHKKTAGLFTLPFLLFWCGREGLNLHALRHWILNPARLPVPPRPHELYCIIYIRGLSNRRGYFGVQLNGLILTRSLSASASTLSAPTCSAAASGIAAQVRASSRAS